MYEHLPGGDLVEAGLRDLGRGIESASALLVTSFAARLRHEGVAVPEHAIADPEHRLYGLLAREDPDSAHGRYNALVRRMVSFSRALPMPELADAERVRRLMRALGERADAEGRVYFTGGATAVLEGWRERMIAADIQAVPDSDRLLQAIPHLKESLRINVEIASPAHFIPETPGWQERSRFIERHGKVSFFHFDFYAQALAKIERGEQKDLGDVREMVSRDQVEPAKAWGLFREIEPKLPLSRHRPDAVPARRRRRPGTRSERIEWIA